MLHDEENDKSYFECPISLDIMQEPIVSSTGHSTDLHSLIADAKRAGRAEYLCVTSQTLFSQNNLIINHALLSAQKECETLEAGGTLNDYYQKIIEQKRSLCNARLHLGMLCPLTLNLLQDPVITPFGITYEKAAIIAYLKTSPSKTDPFNGNALTQEQLIPNINLRDAVIALSKTYLIAKEPLLHVNVKNALQAMLVLQKTPEARQLEKKIRDKEKKARRQRLKNEKKEQRLQEKIIAQHLKAEAIAKRLQEEKQEAAFIRENEQKYEVKYEEKQCFNLFSSFAFIPLLPLTFYYLFFVIVSPFFYDHCPIPSFGNPTRIVDHYMAVNKLLNRSYYPKDRHIKKTPLFFESVLEFMPKKIINFAIEHCEKDLVQAMMYYQGTSTLIEFFEQANDDENDKNKKQILASMHPALLVNYVHRQLDLNNTNSLVPLMMTIAQYTHIDDYKGDYNKNIIKFLKKSVLQYLLQVPCEQPFSQKKEKEIIFFLPRLINNILTFFNITTFDSSLKNFGAVLLFVTMDNPFTKTLSCSNKIKHTMINCLLEKKVDPHTPIFFKIEQAEYKNINPLTQAALCDSRSLGMLKTHGFFLTADEKKFVREHRRKKNACKDFIEKYRIMDQGIA